MCDPIYRLATMNDVEALVELRMAFLSEAAGATAQDADLRRSIQEYFASALPAGAFVSYVAETQGQIIAASGMVFHQHPPSPASLSGKVAYIMNMFTVPTHRRRGIGTALLNRLIHHARNAGCGQVVLHALPLAKPIYAKAGFRSSDTEMRLDLIKRGKNDSGM